MLIIVKEITIHPNKKIIQEENMNNEKTGANLNIAMNYRSTFMDFSKW